MSLKTGSKAPAFTAVTDTGEKVRLSDFRGRRVILYFYPRANTPGCTTQACGFRDDFDAYEVQDAVILGISPDTIRKQSNLKRSSTYPFPYLLMRIMKLRSDTEYGN